MDVLSHVLSQVDVLSHVLSQVDVLSHVLSQVDVLTVSGLPARQLTRALLLLSEQGCG